ncbi:hypothetical protein IFR04_004032 [Cadophora malorum]|uniref:Uncharacterized protein n=1 Tax=Cadophora malorum TaxID=108018 RepID=A0A8H8BSP6_9HELO|nr:hypothetical protein IFR04_004032 [Cadophora malorum]
MVELTEAINSMFDWYRNSAVCYAYLGDTSSEENPHDKGSQFRKSVWFTRGWTLQELLAPTHDSVTHNPTTGSWYCDYKEVTIAQCMAWAANRQTEKVEDKA